MSGVSMRDRKVKLPKTIILKSGLALRQAPEKIERFGIWYEYIIEIGNDNIAYLTIDDDAVRALAALETESSIL